MLGSIGCYRGDRGRSGVKRPREQCCSLLFCLGQNRPLHWHHIETRFISVFLGQKIIFLASDDGKAFEKQRNVFPLVSKLISCNWFMTSVLQYLADYLKALWGLIREEKKRTHINASHPTPFLFRGETRAYWSHKRL